MTRFATALAALSLAAPSSAAHVFRALSDGPSLTVASSIRTLQSDGAEAEGPTINVPEYSDDQCRTWLAGVLAADENGSKGLSEDEFHDFLEGIDDPPYLSAFFDKHSESYLALPWLLKVAHKSLACRCQALGRGEGCCAGEGAEIPLLGLMDDAEERQVLTEEQQKIAAEFRADVCDSVAAVFEKVVPEPEPTMAPVTGFPVAAPEVGEPVAPTDAPVAATMTTDAPVPAPCGTGTERPCPGGVPVDVKGLGLNIVGSVLDYSSFDYDEILKRRLSIPDYYNAQEIMTNEDGNDILSHAIKGFGVLSNQLLVSLPGVGEAGSGAWRNLRGGRDLQSKAELQPVQVSDIPCPDGLAYAPKGAYCVNFGFRFESVPDNENLMSSLIDRLVAAVSEGTLYDVIIDEHPDTLIKGMGSPGKGVDYRTGETGGASNVVTPDIVTAAATDDAAAAEDDGSGGLSTGLIILIILCVIAVPMVLLALYSKNQKAQAKERMERLAEHEAKRDLESRKNQGLPGLVEEDDQSAASAEFVDPADDGASARRVSAGSSLAAMGAAGAAATIPTREDRANDKSKIRASVEKLVDETNAPKTADELLATYEGREEDLVAHLSTMKKRQDTNVEILSLVDKTNPPKSADELLAAYAGREEDLLKNLRKMNEKIEQKAEITRIVEEVKPGKTAEELLAAYSGREDELLKNLKRMQSGKVQAAKVEETKASIRNLVDETVPGKTADELLATYEEREDDLLKNLKKLKSKQDLKASQKDSIKALVEETKPGKSAEELMAVYAGREDELIQNLEKMKAKMEITSSQKDSVRKLVDETRPGKTADELLAAYSGREDELIKNLEKMKAKQERQSAKESKAASVRQLVDETNPGKSAEELLALYDGKEDELIKNLEKMKAKQAKQVLQKEDEEAEVKARRATQTAQKEIETSALASKMDSVRNLVDETKPGKTADELLAMYEGKEDELIKNLEKMKAKQEKMAVKNRELKAEKQKSIRALVDETIPGKSADELLEMYEGKEDQLMKNLEKMKSKQKIKDNANKQQSIRQLVNETNPGKTADELLSMYDGKEDELIKNLEKMKAKQSKKAADELKEKALQVSRIKSLVDETKPGKPAEELLAAYEGKEEELLKNLTKMKSKQEAKAKKEKRELVRLLVDQTNPGKSADELLAAYEGKEEELIKNLTKMKSKQGLKKAKSVKMETPGATSVTKANDKAAMKNLVAALVAETNPGKSSDDLLAAYEGREEELVAHLKKLKASKRKVV